MTVQVDKLQSGDTYDVMVDNGVYVYRNGELMPKCSYKVNTML